MPCIDCLFFFSFSLTDLCSVAVTSSLQPFISQNLTKTKVVNTQLTRLINRYTDKKKATRAEMWREHWEDVLLFLRYSLHTTHHDACRTAPLTRITHTCTQLSQPMHNRTNGINTNQCAGSSTGGPTVSLHYKQVKTALTTPRAISMKKCWIKLNIDTYS